MKKIRGNIDYKNLWEKVNNQVDEAPVAPAKEQEAPETEEKPVEEEPESPKDESASSKITTQSGAIDYSNKIIGVLEEKQKKFNKEHNKRVPIAKFKKVFSRCGKVLLVTQKIFIIFYTFTLSNV